MELKTVELFVLAIFFLTFTVAVLHLNKKEKKKSRSAGVYGFLLAALLLLLVLLPLSFKLQKPTATSETLNVYQAGSSKDIIKKNDKIYLLYCTQVGVNQTIKAINLKNVTLRTSEQSIDRLTLKKEEYKLGFITYTNYILLYNKSYDINDL